jgi:molybdenum cofactor guanylyltransferase
MAEKQITAVILAGGRGTRLGGADKGLVKIAGRELISYAIEALTPQVSEIIIVANRHINQYDHFGLTVLADSHSGYQGPLAGILTALEYSTTPYLLSVPCDAPLLAADFAARMLHALDNNQANASVAECNSHWQSVHCLVKRSVIDSAEKTLQHHDIAINAWLQSLGAVSVDFSDSPLQFENINNEADQARLEKLLTQNCETV